MGRGHVAAGVAQVVPTRIGRWATEHGGQGYYLFPTTDAKNGGWERAAGNAATAQIDTADLNYRHHFAEHGPHSLIAGFGYRAVHADANLTPPTTVTRPQRTDQLFSVFAEDTVALAERLHAPVLTTFKAKGLIADTHPLAGGVLGTLELLLRCRDELGTLPHLSPALGTQVRTNSEAVTGVLQPPGGPDLTEGPSISTDFHPDGRTHVTQNRYTGGGRLLRFQVGPLVDGADPARRARDTLAAIARHPLRHLRVMAARDFEQRFTALTVMQRGTGDLRLRWRRSPLRPWRRALRSSRGGGAASPSYLPVANDVTRAFAHASGGTPLNLLPESVGGQSVTAHILGGAVISADPRAGVVDVRHEVFGHPGLYVADASVIPADVGVNPSLTITALAERFAAAWPERAAEPAPRRPLPEHPLPAGLAALTRLWRALPAPPVAALEGDRRARFVGPRALRAAAPRSIALLGLPGWWGKRFDADGSGTNIVDGGAGTKLAMRARVAPSALDGRPVLLVSYAADAPEPWRRVRDEFRALPDGRLLGMSCVPAGPATRGLPFVLDLPAP